MEESKIDEKFPLFMPYLEWVEKAEIIDGIDPSTTVGKKVEKWNNNERVSKLN